jgi:hypothetical protein
VIGSCERFDTSIDQKRRVGGTRNDDRHAGKGTASPEFRPRARGATVKTAVEMPSLWKPKSGSHRDLEISHRTRDSHIPTAAHPLSQKGEDEERRLPGATSDQQEDLNDLDLRICLDKWVHFKDRLATFIYSDAKRQATLAGRDGEEAFSRVLGMEARTVVVLYREGWGEQGFTAVEATAIRNRAREVGYDFTTFIPLNKPPTVPRWLPQNRLWIGLERWGIEHAATVIEVARAGSWWDTSGGDRCGRGG